MKYSIQRKIHRTYSVFIAVLLFLGVIVFYTYNYYTARGNLYRDMSDRSFLIRNNIENLYAQMDMNLKTIHSLNEFMNIARDNNNKTNRDYFIGNPKMAEKMRRLLLSVLISELRGASIYYINKNGDLLRMSSVGTEYHRENLGREIIEKNSFVKEAFDTEKFKIGLSPGRDYLTDSNKTVISVIRPVRDMKQIYGLLIMTMEIEALTGRIIGSEDPDYENFTVIAFDDEGYSEIFSSGKLDDELKFSLFRSDSSYAEVGKIDKNHIGVVYELKEYGYKLGVVRDISGFNKEMTIIGLIYAVMSFLIFAAVILMSFVLSKKNTLRLRMLTEQLRNQDIEKMNVKIEDADNETQILGETINSLMGKIALQNRNLMEAKELAMKAHYESMQAQMNPHFLYNTLSVIGAYGMERGDFTVPNMCNELASILRYSISYSDESVRLKDEIENIKSYLYLMKMRHEDRFHYSFKIQDESILDQEVPKLILQPLAENCFKHAFVNSEGDWKIDMKLYHDEDKWYFQIKNNGNLFDRDKLLGIQNRIFVFKNYYDGSKGLDYEHMEEKKHFGLENTLMRLYIFYKGEEYYEIATDEKDTCIIIGGPRHDKE